MPSRKLSGSQLRKFRSDVAKLKAKGLVGKRVDARSQRPTRYMQEQTRKFSDVLEGKATVLHIKGRKAKQFSDQFRVKRGAVVVPHEPGEHISYNRKTNTVKGTRKVEGRKVTKEFFANDFSSVQRLPALKQNQLYTLRFAGGQVFRWDNKADMEAFMYPYETNPRNPFHNWWKYINIETIAA